MWEHFGIRGSATNYLALALVSQALVSAKAQRGGVASAMGLLFSREELNVGKCVVFFGWAP